VGSIGSVYIIYKRENKQENIIYFGLERVIYYRLY